MRQFLLVCGDWYGDAHINFLYQLLLVENLGWKIKLILNVLTYLTETWYSEIMQEMVTQNSYDLLDFCL